MRRKSTTRQTPTGSAGTNRRDLLKFAAGTVAALPILGAPAIVKAQGTRRYLKPIVAGLNAKPGDPSYISISRIPEILKEKHDIELEIVIHPNSTLGTDLSQLEAVQTGFIDITSNTSSQFTVFSDAFSFVDLPYAITNWDMANRLFKSDLWKQQSKAFEEATPLTVLPPVGAGGYRMLWNNQRPLPAPSAVDGLKFRSTRSPLVIDLIKNWGGNPTPLAWTETYNALKNGLVDGFHVQPIWTYLFNMYEVLKYATEVDASFAVQFQVMNKNTYMSMPEDIRTAFFEAAQMAADEGNADDEALEVSYKDKLREKGMEIYKPTEAEKKEWMAGGEKVWETQGASIDKAVIDQLVALR